MRNIFVLVFILFSTCVFAQKPAADSAGQYIPLLKGKKIGFTGNHTSLVGNKHLLDVLIENDVDVVKIYAPEHGFRGTAGAGELIDNATDSKTGLPIISIYGNNKKPNKEQLSGIDCMVFDMQDVGTRFFTYLSTMHYVMEACAENGIGVMVLDRPNPNGFYIDGAILEPDCKSFVGMHKIPVVHGMTLGELAQMINGEGWLANGIKCDLTVIPCINYTHHSRYALPVRPSPNLPDMQAIYLYPTLCFLEGYPVSVGRGTEFPFKVFGTPAFKGNKKYTFTFTPVTSDGKIKPLYEGEVCYGKDFRNIDTENINEIDLSLLIDVYNDYKNKDKFFKSIFPLLAGTKKLQKQIAEGKTPAEIRATWQPGLEEFKLKRKKYLLYPDFY